MDLMLIGTGFARHTEHIHRKFASRESHGCKAHGHKAACLVLRLEKVEMGGTLPLTRCNHGVSHTVQSWCIWLGV